MMSQQAITVEFVFGPYDGHRQRTDESHLNELVSLPISNHVFAMLHGRPAAGKEAVTGIAWYELEREGDRARYTFLVKEPVGDCFGK